MEQACAEEGDRGIQIDDGEDVQSVKGERFEVENSNGITSRGCGGGAGIGLHFVEDSRGNRGNRGLPW